MEQLAFFSCLMAGTDLDRYDSRLLADMGITRDCTYVSDDDSRRAYLQAGPEPVRLLDWIVNLLPGGHGSVRGPIAHSHG